MDYFDDCSWYESDDVESWEEDACWIDSQYEAEEGDAEGEAKAPPFFCMMKTEKVITCSLFISLLALISIDC